MEYYISYWLYWQYYIKQIKNGVYNMKFVKWFLVILMLVAIAGLGVYMCSNLKETGKNEVVVMI